MDFSWIILIVLIVGAVWWLLNRRNSGKAPVDDGQDRPAAAPADGIRADGALAAGGAAASADAAATAGLPSAAGFGRPAEPEPPTTADEPAELSASASAPGSAVPASQEPETSAPDVTAPRAGQVPDEESEWETQWSEAGGGPAPRATAAHPVPADTPDAAASGDAAPAGPAEPVHHPEYTAPHSPTLPGAESAAAEAVADESAREEPAHEAAGHEQAGAVEAATEEPAPDIRPEPQAGAPAAAAGESGPAGYGTGAEPAGHLAADRPYGEGSASPSADGSGPAGFTVKGDAATMVYYEEGNPDYEQAPAGVWFESAAHAEAAGFRAPRRRRLQ